MKLLVLLIILCSFITTAIAHIIHPHQQRRSSNQSRVNNEDPRTTPRNRGHARNVDPTRDPRQIPRDRRRRRNIDPTRDPRQIPRDRNQKKMSIYNTPRYIQTIFNFTHPESVVTRKNSIWISDMGKDTGDTKNADGYLIKTSVNGDIDTHFNVRTPLHSPMGMSIIKKNLIVTDIDRILILNKDNGEFKFCIQLDQHKVNFLNDIIPINNNLLLVTATNLKKVFVINLETRSYSESKIDLKGFTPNGLAFDKLNRVLYISANTEHKLGKKGNGAVLKYLYRDDKFKYSNKVHLGRFIDGISIKESDLIISDWNGLKDSGILFILDKESLEQKKSFYTKTSGLADIDYNKEKKLLIAPNLIDGEVYIYDY